VDKRTKRLLDAGLKFVDTETGEAFDTKRTKAGTYIVSVPTDKNRSFTVSAEKAGFQFRNATVQVKAGEKGTRILDRLLEMEALAQNRPRILKNLYFDFDKVNLRPASKLELDLLENMLRENPKIIIEVAGHTDQVGTEDYNQRLSERRAQAVVNYLVSKGIDHSRLRAKGYGKRIPIATNDDEDEGRQLNRRTEFEIMSGRTE
jgi:outer membrane protein OmpA-like peptidoglycan-associated protein